MTKPITPDTGHAFLVVLGGKYSSSIIAEALIAGKHHVPCKADDPLIDLEFVHGTGGFTGTWVLGEHDFRWASLTEIEKKFMCTDVNDLTPAVRNATVSCDGAWIMRVYPKPTRGK